jgi:hypothetical protein
VVHALEQLGSATEDHSVDVSDRDAGILESAAGGLIDQTREADVIAPLLALGLTCADYRYLSHGILELIT